MLQKTSTNSNKYPFQMYSFMHDAYRARLMILSTWKSSLKEHRNLLKSIHDGKKKCKLLFFLKKEVKYTWGCHGLQVPHYKLELFIIIASIITYFIAGDSKKISIWYQGYQVLMCTLMSFLSKFLYWAFFFLLK